MNRNQLNTRWIVSIFLLLPLFCISCKTSDDAIATATQMNAAASALADYYAGLDLVVENNEKLERLQHALLGVPLDDQDLHRLNMIHVELAKRAEMAHALATLSAAFTNLTGSTAAADAAAAASDLGTELSGISQIPGSSYVPTALPPIAKILTQFQLERDERKLAKSMEPTLNALEDMFTHERPAYDSINKTYMVLAQSQATELVQRNMVDPGVLMDPALAPLGFVPRISSEQVPQWLQTYARDEIDRRGQDEIAAYSAASDTMDQCLKEMSARVHTLANDGKMQKRGFPFTLANVQEWIKQLQ